MHDCYLLNEGEYVVVTDNTSYHLAFYEGLSDKWHR